MHSPNVTLSGEYFYSVESEDFKEMNDLVNLEGDVACSLCFLMGMLV